MRRRALEFMERWLHILLAIALCAMLALLSWGISESDVVASMIAGALLAAVIVLGGSVVLVPDSLRPS